MIRRALRAIRSSKRAQHAIVGNGLVSLASLALSVSVARLATASEFGNFAIALVAHLFITGATRAGITDTVLARPGVPSSCARSFRRVSLIGVVATLALGAWGLLAGNVYLLILAGAIHGLLALDFMRTYESAVGNDRHGFGMSVLWSSLTLGGVLASFVAPLPPWLTLVVWAAGGAACGYSAAIRARLPWAPGWPRDRNESRAAAAFSLDYLVGSGGSAITTLLAGVAVNSLVVGALRGAGTLLGPVNLIASTARSLVIPALARATSTPAGELRTATRLTLMLGLGITPLLILVQAIPARWGEWLLGDTWSVASAVLLPIAVESLFALIGSVPSAGHRAAFAGRRTLILRLSVGVPRPFVVVGGALLWGAPGAAWLMAGIAVLNALVWWASYCSLVAKRAAA